MFLGIIPRNVPGNYSRNIRNVHGIIGMFLEQFLRNYSRIIPRFLGISGIKFLGIIPGIIPRIFLECSRNIPGIIPDLELKTRNILVIPRRKVL